MNGESFRWLSPLISIFVFVVFPGLPFTFAFANAVTTTESRLPSSVGIVQVSDNAEANKFLMSSHKFHKLWIGNFAATVCWNQYSLTAKKIVFDLFFIWKHHVGWQSVIVIANKLKTLDLDNMCRRVSDIDRGENKMSNFIGRQFVSYMEPLNYQARSVGKDELRICEIELLGGEIDLLLSSILKSVGGKPQAPRKCGDCNSS